jgi:WD40 repeat protein
VLSLAFSPDGKILTSSSNDRSIRFWHPFPGEEVKSFTDLATPVKHLVYVVDTPQDQPQADAMVQLMGTTHALLVWQPETGQRLHSLWGNRSPISALASTADGKVIVTGSPEKTIQIWHLPDMMPPPP